MLGMGRNSIHTMLCLEQREAIDITKLQQFLEENLHEPCIVVANAGTVNTVDFDDLQAIGELKSDTLSGFISMRPLVALRPVHQSIVTLLRA